MVTFNAVLSKPMHHCEMNEVHVAVRLNRKERLKTFTTASSINLIADRDETFTSAQFDSLRRFDSFLRSNYTELFPTIVRPILNIFLVLLRSTIAKSSGAPEVRICISGLRSHEQIIQFHDVLTQSHCRVHYDPLKLCYSTKLIELAGLETLDTFYVTRGPDTLVGSHLTSDICRTGVVSKSTIGGIIDINGRSYAITIAHGKNKDHQSSSESTTDGDSSFSERTLLGNENLDLEPPLVIDSWSNDGDIDVWNWAMETTDSTTFSSTKDGRLVTNWRPKREEVVMLDDWALIPIPPQSKRPNSFVLPGTSGVTPKPRYIVGFSEKADKVPVSILSGKKRIGMLSRNISFLMQESGVSQEVRTAQLPLDEPLQLGDSGSWVVDLSNNSLIGSVTAASPGIAYVAPFSDLQGKLRNHYGKSVDISMPLPFATFMGILHTEESNTNPYLGHMISEKCLQASTGDVVARYLLSSIKLGKAADVKRLVEGMKFDHGALKKLFEDISKLEQNGLPDNDTEMFALARTIAGDQKVDTESQDSSKAVDSTMPHKATSIISTTRNMHDIMLRITSRGKSSKPRSIPAAPGSSKDPESISGTRSSVSGSSKFSSDSLLDRSTARLANPPSTQAQAPPLPLSQRKYHRRAFDNVTTHRSATPLRVHTRTRSGIHGSGYYSGNPSSDTKPSIPPITDDSFI